MSRIAKVLSALLALIAVAGTAHAQGSTPNKPVRLVVIFPPGGGADSVARLFADKMTTQLGQTVLVENRPGASGIIAGKQVAAADPDGTTVLVASNSTVVAQVMNPNSAFDLSRDLRALASVAPQAIIIVAQPELSANTFQELVALAKTRRSTTARPEPARSRICWAFICSA